jgi:hypothetical protein
MPAYKNQLPLAPDTTVWHHTSLDAVVSMLREGKMRLTRVDTFSISDPFECPVPKKQMDDQLAIFSGAVAANMMMTSVAAHYPGMLAPCMRSRDPWEETTQRRRAQMRSAHAMCWRHGEESEPMWQLYCNDRGLKGQGLALRSTLAKLEASVAQHDLYVCPVRYRRYHDGDAFNDQLDAFMHKRQGFAYEQEVRLLRYDQAQYSAIAGFLYRSGMDERIYGPLGTAPDELPEHIHLDWRLAGAIDAITVSPYAHAAYGDEARRAVAAVDPALAERIAPSELGEPYPPYF